MIGGGPAGLIAAEQLAEAGASVDLYDAMPSVARKFLLAGIGGMNITHSESFDRFSQRYGDAGAWLLPMLENFGPAELVDWIHELGIETIIGSSGRVFPVEMKAAPLLRKWKHRLTQSGVRFHPRHRWIGWDQQDRLVFESQAGQVVVKYDVCVLALGGGSWSKLGSNGAWIPLLLQRGVDVTPLVASNCGYEVSWSDHLVQRADRQAIKKVGLSVEGFDESKISEVMITDYGIEGTGIYAMGRYIRRAINSTGVAVLKMDLFPDRSAGQLSKVLARGAPKVSLANRLRKNLSMSSAQIALANEEGVLSRLDEQQIVARLKGVTLRLSKARPIDEAISTAGGISPDAILPSLMLKQLPSVFVAGEMLDWDAPTGGYLLTGCFTTGVKAGRSAAEWLRSRSTIC